MPKLAASVAAFVVIVFGIGFNMVRYPIVWESVGASSDLSQPLESSRSEAVLEPLAPVQPEAMPDPPESWRTAHVGYAPDDDPIGGTAYRSASSGEDDEPVDGGTHDAAPSQFGVPWQDRPYQSSWQQVDDPSEAPAESGSRRRLVPVTRPGSRSEPVDPAGTEQQVHRLPPVERIDRTAADQDLPQSHDGPVPFYPSTGIEGADARPDLRAVGRLP